MTSRPHDALFKAAFEHPEHAGGLLRSILPAPLCAAIDWQTLTHEPGSFIDPLLADRHTDLLFSAALDNDSRAWFYLLLEHQSTLDDDMPRRMLGYLLNFWDRHRKQHPNPLPVVIPILICHAPDGWTAPTTMQALFEPSLVEAAGIDEFVPHFRLLVEDLAHLSNDEIRHFALAAFPMLALWLLRDARDADKVFANLDYWADAFYDAVHAPSGMQALIQLLSYVSWVFSDKHYQRFCETIRKRLPEAKNTMITAAETMIEQGRKEGLEKGREIGFEIGRVQGLEMGREEGRVQGQTTLLVKLLTLKFGPISPSHQALISNATLEQLELYATRVLFADTISSVFED